MTVPSTQVDIINKVRRITARPSSAQISDTEILNYINTAYIYDLPSQLKLESLRVNYQFVTQPNVAVYNFPTDLYLTTMPPVYIGGYQGTMSQSRESFFRYNSRLFFMENNVAVGGGGPGPYTGTLTATPVMRGFPPNLNSIAQVEMQYFNWQVTFSGPVTVGVITTMTILVDDGQGNLRDISDTTTSAPRGTIDYITGVFSAKFAQPVDVGGQITAQYIPYVASRPNSALFFQDQIQLYPVPDNAYTVSFEAYRKPTSLPSAAIPTSPQVKELWQLLAFMASEKIFIDNGDIDNAMKYHPFLEEQLKLCLRRTISQYSVERAATIYTEQTGLLYPFGNIFTGI